MYQKFIVAGYLGGDPEMRYLPDGTAVTNFSVATTRRFSDRKDNPREETTWVRVETWRRMAENCNQYLSRGSSVIIEGRLKPDPKTGSPRTFTRQDGTVGASYEVVAENVRFLGRGNGNGPDNGTAGEQATAAQIEDEIPF
ncbi:MAG: single-stranded DNA-binding protein [Chloroflexi bacterium]|nr:single-stranded DNA-binding protein [Chloroflexota bacterium]